MGPRFRTPRAGGDCQKSPEALLLAEFAKRRLAICGTMHTMSTSQSGTNHNTTHQEQTSAGTPFLGFDVGHYWPRVSFGGEQLHSHHTGSDVALGGCGPHGQRDSRGMLQGIHPVVG